ncbi:uncharacterized protein LOC142981676 [Anticarsia gemmatalis]|uniref:uncharacterized protein LOC142981676 n=1 Tax=Anticarsia gemmatalis TaxID=129554 RepID=UPI003F757360
MKSILVLTSLLLLPISSYTQFFSLPDFLLGPLLSGLSAVTKQCPSATAQQLASASYLAASNNTAPVNNTALTSPAVPKPPEDPLASFTKAVNSTADALSQVANQVASAIQSAVNNG